ncbi:hypothetical protein, partial [Rhizobium sp. Root483D2]|uniref:hypothetical protein n=1 Tax=Rhizobium sp. Root483D2 TaxID=1736545 RepID=UPI001AECD4D8
KCVKHVSEHLSGMSPGFTTRAGMREIWERRQLPEWPAEFLDKTVVRRPAIKGKVPPSPILRTISSDLTGH